MGTKRDDEDIRRELRSHLELETEEQRAAGLAEAQAREAARRRFGNLAVAAESTRGVWVSHTWEALRRDLRFGVRMIGKSPGFSAIAILTLALGIGANAVIYSLVSGVLLRPLEYTDPDRLVTVLNDGRGPVPPADFLDWKRDATSFAQLSAAGGWSATVSGGDRPDELRGLQLSSGMFELLGVPPLLGRPPSAEEHVAGKDRVVVLGYGLWKRLFGGDVGILGKSVNINGSAHTVIGVMPAAFRFAPFWITRAEIWAPLSLGGREGDREASFLRVFGRLKPGVSLAQAQTEMTEISRRLQEAYPESNRGRSARVDPLLEKVVGNVRSALLMLLGAVGFVLLIACTNIANLSLARGSERHKEIAVRLALGAARSRVVTQFLTENLVLALAGGALGLAIAYWGIDVLKVLVGNRVPRMQEMSLDRGVLLFTGILSLMTGLLFGLIPAMQAGKQEAGSVLKEGMRGTSQDQGGVNLRGALIVAQVAISLVLLTGAGLLTRSFLKLRSVDPGFDPANVLTARVSLMGQAAYVGEGRESFFRNLESAVRALPGVQAVSMINHLPLAGDNWGTRVYPENQPVPAPEAIVRSTYRVTRPGYFDTMRIRILDGQDFRASDKAGAPDVVVINERLAKHLWPAERAVGKRVSLADPRRDPRWRTVIGVIADVKESSWESVPDEEIYLPFQQAESFLNGLQPQSTSMTLVARTSVEPSTLVRALQSTVWTINQDVPVIEVQSMEEVISDKLWQSRFHLMLLGSFAAFALVLAAIGIYGVMAYAVVRRRQEIGIRMALGARQSSVVWMVLSQGLRLVLAGVVVGLLLSLALTQFLTTVLYQVPARDGVTFAVIPVVLAFVALVAGYLPARRASAIDPMIALRCD